MTRAIVRSPGSGSSGEGEPAWLRQAAASASKMAREEEQEAAEAEAEMDHMATPFTEDVIFGTPTLIRFKPKLQPALDPPQASDGEACSIVPASGTTTPGGGREKPAAAPLERSSTLRLPLQWHDKRQPQWRLSSQSQICSSLKHTKYSLW